MNIDRYINCSAHSSSEGNVLLGDTHTALFDCGMIFCVEETMQKVKAALNGRPLDYIFASHTHYDHIAALPFFRKEWPGLQLITCETGAAVLLKDTPRRVIRELSAVASKEQGKTFDGNYSDDAFYADIIVKDKDVISLGGISVEILETPGHTRDTLSFFVPQIKLLILSETMGVFLPDGVVYPLYLTSYNTTITSIEKCSEIDFEFLSLPHRGLTNDKDAREFFGKSLASNIACRDFILELKANNYSQDEMQERYYEKYATEALLSYQPEAAFLANAHATLACTLREHTEDTNRKG